MTTLISVSLVLLLVLLLLLVVLLLLSLLLLLLLLTLLLVAEGWLFLVIINITIGGRRMALWIAALFDRFSDWVTMLNTKHVKCMHKLLYSRSPLR